jgi:hypothetical protein
MAKNSEELIRLEIERFARRLSRKYLYAFKDGQGYGIKKKVIRWIRSALPPHPGRPLDPAISLACKLRRKGMEWPEIYRLCIPNFDCLHWGERRKKLRSLRNSYRGRIRRRKNSSRISYQENNPAALIAPAASPIVAA